MISRLFTWFEIILIVFFEWSINPRNNYNLLLWETWTEIQWVTFRYLPQFHRCSPYVFHLQRKTNEKQLPILPDGITFERATGNFSHSSKRHTSSYSGDTEKKKEAKRKFWLRNNFCDFTTDNAQNDTRVQKSRLRPFVAADRYAAKITRTKGGRITLNFDQRQPYNVRDGISIFSCIQKKPRRRDCIK